MAELKEGRLFEMFGRLHVENNLLREEVARLRAEIVDLQASAISEVTEVDRGR